MLFTFIAIYAISRLVRVNVDYRFLIVGSILPDLIDKPIGRFLFAGYFQNGRIFGHALIFTICLALLAIYLDRRYHIAGVIFLAVGSFMHQLEDVMLLDPRTFFWPVFGWRFPIRPMDDYTGQLLQELLSNPFSIGLEVVFGLLMVAAMALYFKLYKKERLSAFICSGALAR